MADSRVHTRVEDWIRKEWMPMKFGVRFSRERIPLRKHAVFEFDAVSDDEKVACCISASALKTASGKLGVSKLHKMRADALFLLMATGLERRLMIFVDPELHTRCLREQDEGRFPEEIELHLAELPADLSTRLFEARKVAADEVRPRK